MPAYPQKTAPVCPDLLVRRMDAYWTQTLGNAVSTDLRKVWRRAAQVFNDRLTTSGTTPAGTGTTANDHPAIPSRPTDWTVIPMPTGTGKTTLIALYCSLLGQTRPGLQEGTTHHEHQQGDVEDHDHGGPVPGTIHQPYNPKQCDLDHGFGGEHYVEGNCCSRQYGFDHCFNYNHDNSFCCSNSLKKELSSCSGASSASGARALEEQGSCSRNKTYNKVINNYGETANHVLNNTVSEALVCNCPHGVLIVLRRKEDVDRLVREINGLACSPVAIGRHSDRKVDGESVRQAPVLVITHEAYRVALKAKSFEDASRQIAGITQWAKGLRRLTIVDEALEIVDHTEVDLDDLTRLIGCVPEYMARHHPEALSLLRGIVSMIEQHRSRGDGAKTEGDARYLWRSQSEDGSRETLSRLAKDLRDLDWSAIARRSRETDYRRDFGDWAAACLDRVSVLCASWCLCSRQGNRTVASTARLIVPAGLPGPVVLDATAEEDRQWHLFDRARVLDGFRRGVRDYSRVTLNVARESSVGKGATLKKAERRLPVLANGLPDGAEGRECRLLLCTHKAVEEALTDMPAKGDVSQLARAFGSRPVDLCHWGAVDGRNDWRDHAAMLIMSLPYRPREWAMRTVIALGGTVDAQTVPDLGNSQIVVSVVQAINRIRCRVITDEQGRCAPCDVSVMLPPGRTGNAVLDAIRRQMPGIRVREWRVSPDGAGADAPRSTVVSRIVDYLESALPGDYPIADIRKQLGISSQAFNKVRNQLSGNSRWVTDRLLAAGVEIIRHPLGDDRTRLSFRKHQA